MKNLYMIGGPMGVGKTTVCQRLKERLPKAVFLDGDWCWDGSPFVVNDETKAMVEDNICHVLNNFIHCTEYENVIFCWVMHQPEIIDGILERLDTEDCRVWAVSLVCSAQALRQRLRRDVDAGLRKADVVTRSLERLPLYDRLNTLKLDVSELTADEAAEKLIEMEEEK